MSELIVLGFDKADEADVILNRLVALEKEYLIDLEDAVVAVRDGDGKVRLKQSVNLTTTGAASGGLSGAIWGSLVGLLFLNPLAGMVLGGAFGAGSGALAGSMTDYGIDDNLIKKLADTIPANSSALFLLVRKAQPEKVLAEFKDMRARILRTSLSPDQEMKLQAALSPKASPESGAAVAS
ncbi:DUF1269 domain-containing protein [Neorhizobium sp. P12A]|uniref:DUF1269 domain-containing protein n=1 Tax=Rhizobium/Agrobacterium group TaxID=227290 RepID=UPI0010502445|nr:MULTISPECIES: DUF1269 domain-containing protein [Rhizobium/Agrobacterium group]KAA0698012.1 DUF1269 domain-containing protein [Neorhizobium sp. P12A]TCR87742.1 putative membrane protein [Rhizobium sp. BK376]